MDFTTLKYSINDLGQFEISWMKSPSWLDKILGRKGGACIYSTPDLNKNTWKRFDKFDVVWFDTSGNVVTDNSKLRDIKQVIDIMAWDDLLCNVSHEEK
ncbi:hypothetical protein NVP1170O_064 [Vibrio phage 1.170.O._10N.261.52.C3]|nr:hypothetical protein NVP1170O_064 [Vibrio phage 1.170.O._10N.261.52.C3]